MAAGCRCLLSAALPPGEGKAERRWATRHNKPCLKWMFTLFLCAAKRFLVIPPRAQTHTNAVRAERQLSSTQTHQALAIRRSQSILFYTNDVFLYSFDFHSSIKVYGFYEWGVFLFSKKNLLTPTVNFCNILFIFFFKFRYVSVKKTKTKMEKKKKPASVFVVNGVYWWVMVLLLTLCAV